jgi:DNA polymerase-3 subunit epsilon
MRSQDRWVILDTETTGIRNPIYPVEIAAQMMSGWKPVGNPFRILLNFDVPIEPMAEKMHGYSREYLREKGLPPKEALSMLLQYVGTTPIVAYNLTYDWNRVLHPLLGRMHIHCQLQPGFCALNLTRRVVPALPDFKLKTVIKTFGLASGQTHHADDDVRLVTQFMSQYLGQHLEQCRIQCLEQVTACAEGNICIAPLKPPAIPRKLKKQEASLEQNSVFAIGELVGICRMIILDKKLTADEINFLSDWLENCPHAGTHPISEMFDLVQRIVADKKVTPQEQQQLAQALEELIKWRL